MVRILVIEDDPVIRDAVLDWLQFEGYEAPGAANGRQGVDLALRPRTAHSSGNSPCAVYLSDHEGRKR
jgi:DNA-binding response OmpR family regulator